MLGKGLGAFNKAPKREKKERLEREGVRSVLLILVLNKDGLYFLMFGAIFK